MTAPRLFLGAEPDPPPLSAPRRRALRPRSLLAPVMDRPVSRFTFEVRPGGGVGFMMVEEWNGHPGERPADGQVEGPWMIFWREMANGSMLRIAFRDGGEHDNPPPRRQPAPQWPRLHGAD
jgi:hypothetical protein